LAAAVVLHCVCLGYGGAKPYDLPHIIGLGVAVLVMAHRSRLPGCPCGKVKRVRALSVLIGRAYRYALAGSSTSEVCGECTFGWAYVPLRAPMIETILNLLGLAFTANLLGLAFIAGGAFIAALSVIISDEQAKRLSEPHYDRNAVYASLRRQIRNARNGLLCVAFGIALQAAGLIYPLFTR